ncbi:MAG: hypothetical protein AB7V16_12640 [Vulcanibacillus sp.]
MPGFTNMEFEAKVMYAIYWYQEGIGEMPVLFNNLSPEEQSKFIKWIEDILAFGITSSNTNTYNILIKIFNDKNPSYANYISSNFPVLSVIQNLLSGCPKTF